jgi:hypothetical protein
MTSRDELLAELLRGNCHEWPTCRCGEKWRFFDETFDRWEREGQPPLSDDEVEEILISLVCMLSCIVAHCWDRRHRQRCARQLLSPVFDEVREGFRPWRN